MRIVALEEHFAFPDLLNQFPPEVLLSGGWPLPGTPLDAMLNRDSLYDLGAKRLAAMDTGGVAVQVLSTAGPGANLLDGDIGIAFARTYNDKLAHAILEHPDRFSGFAHLPMTAPEAAADELERTVRELGFLGAMINGVTQGRFLDDPMFDPILARAEALDVPLYIHPGLPPGNVRMAYYDGLPVNIGFLLSTAGWGWHAETALHVLRLVLSGTLERYPRLKLIVGHMGEGLPLMLNRADNVFAKATKSYLGRTVSQTLHDQLWITIGGFLTLPSFLAVLTTFGADRILYSVDWPYGNNDYATSFLLGLPISPTDMAKIAHGNADKLLKIRV